MNDLDKSRTIYFFFHKKRLIILFEVSDSNPTYAVDFYLCLEENMSSGANNTQGGQQPEEVLSQEVADLLAQSWNGKLRMIKAI